MLTARDTVEPEIERTAAAMPGRWALNGAVLAATDGSPASDGAVRIAHLLATRDGVPLRLLPVLAPTPFPISLLLPGWAESSEYVRREHLLDCVSTQLERATGKEPVERPRVELGRPADVIAEIARSEVIAVAIAGIRRQGCVRQSIGEEAILEVMRQATFPVLAARDDVTTLPRRVMIAVDFSPGSVNAARLARTLVADGGTITLVHVQPNLDYFASAGPACESIYTSGMTTLLDRLCRELSSTDHVQVATEVQSGDPAAQLLEVARRGQFDLVVSGCHGSGPNERLLVGSVAARLVHGVECSVLVAPAHGGWE